ncbi:MAG: hypothetical protein HRT74_02340, partial [Flavobacteriales bacterium]|nr:hypothetical protein [Flavobacteriales bacterium]
MFDRSKYLKKSSVVCGGSDAQEASAIPEREKLYQRLFEKSTTLLLVYDREGKMIKANRMPCGSEVESSKGTVWQESYPQEVVELKLQKIKEAKELNAQVEFSLSVPLEDSTVHYKCLVKPIGEELGWEHYLLEMLDVTELVESQMAYEEEKSFSQAITNTVPFIVYVMDLFSGK